MQHSACMSSTMTSDEPLKGVPVSAGPEVSPATTKGGSPSATSIKHQDRKVKE